MWSQSIPKAPIDLREALHTPPAGQNTPPTAAPAQLALCFATQRAAGRNFEQHSLHPWSGRDMFDVLDHVASEVSMVRLIADLVIESKN